MCTLRWREKYGFLRVKFVFRSENAFSGKNASNLTKAMKIINSEKLKKDDFQLAIWDVGSVQRCVLCRIWRKLSNEC